MAKRQAEIGSPRPVSAFAARKFTTNLPEVVDKSQNVSEASQVSVANPSGRPLAKKQRTRVKQKALLASTTTKKSANIVDPISNDSLTEVGKVDQLADIISNSDDSDSANGQTDSDHGSDFERDDSVSDIIEPGEIPVQQLSTFTATKNNVLYDTVKEWAISLGGRDTLTLIGQYDVWVRRGAVTILGAVLRPSSRLYRVYAPSTHSLPSLQLLQDPFGPPNQSAEISIFACGTGIRLLKHAIPKFRRIWNYKNDTGDSDNSIVGLHGRTFAHLKTSADDRYKRPLRLIEHLTDRQSLIAKLLTVNPVGPPTVMISGPKGSGKSTFARMLVNAMLTRSASTSQSNKLMLTDGVAFLDVDPGQPEFSPPGDLSLIHLRDCYFGPPFTHPLIAVGSGDALVRAHHIGALSPKEDQKHYINCALDLLRAYRELRSRYSSCPLILNCAGWIQSVGLEVLLELINFQCFSDIVYTSTHGPQDVVESLGNAANKVGSSMHFLTSQGSEAATRTSADLRAMQTVSYFHLDEPEAGNLRWDSTPVTQQSPLVVHWSGDKQALLAVMVLDEFDPDTLFTLLDGCVVGLVAIEDDQALPGCTASERERPGPDLNEHLEDVEQDPGTPSVPPNPFAVARVDSTSDSDPDSESTTNLASPQKQARLPDGPDRNPNGTEPLTGHFMHPSVSRNSDNIPYLNFEAMGSKRLDPSKSHSVGQALVRGMDLRAQCFHLLTPIPSETLQRLYEQKTKLVLVRGKLDMPKWAFKEEYESGATFRRKLRKEDAEAADHIEAADMRQWAEGTPYVSGVNEERIKSASAKVWRVRRDLKPRVSGDDTD